jgi:hypothetical protein
MQQNPDFSLVLSPIQMAALLQEESIDPVSAHSNRLWGGVGIIGGAIELIGAGALLLAPDPTMTTKIGGALLAAHGLDTLSTNANQAWNGRQAKSFTSKAASSAARSLGVDAGTAGTIGASVDIAVPVVVGGLLGALRVVSIRAGTINFLAKEAAGGHAIARHVGKSEAWLRSRLAAEAHIPAATSFKSIKEATAVISKAVKVNSAAIKSAMHSANVGQSYAFQYNAGKVIGYGVTRRANVLQDMTKIRVVLKKISHGGKVYFLLTAFPIP